MAEPKRICRTSRGSTIDAVGNGRYRVCDRNLKCAEVEGLWKAYETLKDQECRNPVAWHH
jgi:hypothetical protein